MKKNRTQNKKLFQRAKGCLVGGVNSPVRSFRSVGGEPLFIQTAKGSRIYDSRGKSFVDFCLSWGALPMGHAPRPVVSALKKTISHGTSFGAATALEIGLAERIQKAIPSIQKIRFVNSGTEAVMSALRLARAFTKRDLILKFDGCYHGHADFLLAKAGSGAFGSPDSAGVPKAFTRHTLIAPYNDLKAAERIIRKHARKIAAMIVEPVAGNMGVILPRKGFLEGLRKICDRHGILLIFDEVITGFRLCYGGAQDLFGVRPDLTCLGKIIGGGLPIGAFGGKKKIMKLLAPEGPVYQAGTFSGNPLSMAAGIAMLDSLRRKGVYKSLEKKAREFYRSICEIAGEARIPMQLNAIGSMFSFFFTSGPVEDADTACLQNKAVFKKFFHSLLREGVYFSPAPFEANFISTAHSKRNIRQTLDAFRKALERL